MEDVVQTYISYCSLTPRTNLRHEFIGTKLIISQNSLTKLYTLRVIFISKDCGKSRSNFAAVRSEFRVWVMLKMCKFWVVRFLGCEARATQTRPQKLPRFHFFDAAEGIKVLGFSERCDFPFFLGGGGVYIRGESKTNSKLNTRQTKNRGWWRG